MLSSTICKPDKVHKIGEHGAVGWITKQGRVCCECGEPIFEDFEYPSLAKACWFMTTSKFKKALFKRVEKYLKRND